MRIHPARLARRFALVSALGLGSASLTLSSSAGATIAPSPSASLSVDSPIPIGGVVTGTVSCYVGCSALPLSIMGIDGAPVPGHFDAGGGTVSGPFVFIPDTRLVAGAYSAYLAGPYIGASASFTVVDAVFEAPTFTSSVTAETVPEGPLITCQQPDPQVATPGFAEKVRVRPLVAVAVAGLYAKQYRYGLTPPGELPRSFSAPPVNRSFDVVGDELCFDILGQPYGNGPVATLGHDCMSLAGLGAGIKDEVHGDVKQTLLGCVVPPAGYEDEWCATFAPAFTSKSCDGFSLDACFGARRGCSEGDHPSEQQERTERDARAGTGSGGGFGNGSGGSGASAGNVNGAASASAGGVGSGTLGDAAKNPSPSADSKACSVGLAPSRGLTSWLASLALLLLLARRRRSAAS
jgi:hypothetical protein